MLTIGISESGNEVGLSPTTLAALSEADRATRIATAATRLREAGAHHVLRSVAELPDLLARL
jgi:phosphonoacetaldehyde hydrolase